MAIIAIAREIAALGEETASEIATTVGYKLIDREYLEKRLEAYGLNPEKRSKYDEKKPGFWASLSQERDDYLHFLKTAMYEEALNGDCVVVGRGGGAIFRAVPSLVSVKLVAPLTARIERAKRFYSCDERHALRIIEQSDHDRASFHKYFFSIAWDDPREYDLVLNTARIDESRIARIIADFTKSAMSPEKEEAGRRRVAELFLGQRVVTEIVYAKKVPVHFLEAAAEGGHVLLHGVANTQAAIDAALSAAKAVPGVTEVESAIQVVQEFTVMP
jgi:cytidylate kinase